MSIDVLCDVMRRQPFEPFRVVVLSGDSFDVRDPAHAMLMRHGIYIARRVDGNLPDGAVYLALDQIAAVEPLAAA